MPEAWNTGTLGGGLCPAVDLSTDMMMKMILGTWMRQAQNRTQWIVKLQLLVSK